MIMMKICDIYKRNYVHKQANDSTECFFLRSPKHLQKLSRFCFLIFLRQKFFKQFFCNAKSFFGTFKRSISEYADESSEL